MTAPWAFVLTIAVSLTMIWLRFRHDMRDARARAHSHGTVVALPDGDIEYAERGSGTDVLIVHAAAGGWDQGALIASALLDERFHWIAPSRFGYLRSPWRPGAAVEDQARDYAYLLDLLGIEKVAVVAMSAGGPSALQFAIDYPHRVSSLTLVSCGVARPPEKLREEADRKGRALVRIFKTDLRLWLATRLFRNRLLELMGAGSATRLALGYEPSLWIDRMLAAMHPASWRQEGVRFDNIAELPGERIAAIQAPTLVIHAKDDTLQLYDHAAFAMAHIPGARLMSFERGGHMLLATERGTIREAVQEHILAHAAKARNVA